MSTLVTYPIDAEPYTETQFGWILDTDDHHWIHAPLAAASRRGTDTTVVNEIIAAYINVTAEKLPPAQFEN